MLLIKKVLSYWSNGGDRINYIEKSHNFHNTVATNLNIATV